VVGVAQGLVAAYVKYRAKLAGVASWHCLQGQRRSTACLLQPPRRAFRGSFHTRSWERSQTVGLKAPQADLGSDRKSRIQILRPNSANNFRKGSHISPKNGKAVFFGLVSFDNKFRHQNYCHHPPAFRCENLGAAEYGPRVNQPWRSIFESNYLAEI